MKKVRMRSVDAITALVYPGLRSPATVSKMLAVIRIDAPDPMRLHGCHQHNIKDILSRDLRMLLQQREDPIGNILAGINLENCGGLEVLLHFFPCFLRRARLCDTTGIGNDGKKLKKDLRTHCHRDITLHALITKLFGRQMIEVVITTSEGDEPIFIHGGDNQGIKGVDEDIGINKNVRSLRQTGKGSCAQFTKPQDRRPGQCTSRYRCRAVADT